MVVEWSLPAIVPGALVALHYGIQILRPRMGYGSDIGRRRTPWIVGGMAALALGAGRRGAGPRRGMVGSNRLAGLAAAGAGLCGGWRRGWRVRHLAAGAAGLPCHAAAPPGCGWHRLDHDDRRHCHHRHPPPASCCSRSHPYGWSWSPPRCPPSRFWSQCWRSGGWSRRGRRPPAGRPEPFWTALHQVWADDHARRFAVFVFLSMLAYSAQELVLEPFAGAVFRLSPGGSTEIIGPAAWRRVGWDAAGRGRRQPRAQRRVNAAVDRWRLRRLWRGDPGAWGMRADWRPGGLAARGVRAWHGQRHFRRVRHRRDD